MVIPDLVHTGCRMTQASAALTPWRFAAGTGRIGSSSRTADPGHGAQWREVYRTN